MTKRYIYYISVRAFGEAKSGKRECNINGPHIDSRTAAVIFVLVVMYVSQQTGYGLYIASRCASLVLYNKDDQEAQQAA